MIASTETAGLLSYDVLIHILDWLRDDFPSLYSCSLVNRTFRDTAATYLYKKVTYSPAYSPVLYLKKNNEFVEGFFASALLPHNATLVRELEVSGYLSSRPPPLNKFSGHLKAAIECWPNVHTIAFIPDQFHESVFSDILPLLLTLSNLRKVVVNLSCTNEKNAATMAQLRNLQSLTIQSPTRAILQLFPEWLGELTSTLRRLHLTNSCGSVTPGVLRSFIPHIQDITSFTLGLSYSLTDNDVFNFLQELPHLRQLEFRYYLQLRPSIIPRLSHLRQLTVNYTNISTRTDAAHLYKWVRHVITYAPLESLCLVCEGEVWGAAPTFNPLLEHLIAGHHDKLRILDMQDCHVGSDVLKQFLASCTQLEELCVAVSPKTMQEFQTYAATAKRLRMANISIRNSNRREEYSVQFAQGIFNSVPTLRDLVLDGKHFEGGWTATSDGSIQFMVREVQGRKRVFP